MSNCGQFEMAIWEAAETGEVSVDLAEHIRGCKQCAHTLTQLQSAMDGFAALTAVDAPDPTRAVHARLESRPGRWRLAPVFAGALAVAVLAWYAAGLSRPPHAPAEKSVSAAGHAPKMHSPKPYIPRLEARKPQAKDEHPRAADSIVRLRPPGKRYPDHRPQVALKPPARPETHENNSAVVNQEPTRQVTYVIVFTSDAEPSSIEVELRNTTTGDITDYRRVIDRDGSERITQATFTRNDANTEEPRT